MLHFSTIFEKLSNDEIIFDICLCGHVKVCSNKSRDEGSLKEEFLKYCLQFY